MAKKEPANLNFEAPPPPDPTDPKKSQATPVGWEMGGNSRPAYIAEVDRTQALHQPASVRLRSTAAVPSDKFGTLLQRFSAERYLGRRVEFSVDLKTSEVVGGVDIWLRSDGKDGRTLTLVNSSKRTPSLTGTNDWIRRAITLDVSPQAEVLSLGIILKGTGQVWINGARFEIVDESTPSGAGAPPTVRQPAK